MAVEQMNDSYGRCLEELRRRYRGRGLSVNVKGELATQTAREFEVRSMAPEAYTLFDAESKIADRYRSGEYLGSKYMTSDDFVRYFKTRRAFYMPTVGSEAVNGGKRNSAVPERRSSRVGSETNGKEGHLAQAKSALKDLATEWFPIERKEGRTEGKKFRLPATALSAIAVFAISLGLIVSGSVMLGNASGQVGKTQATIQKLEAEQAELEARLDLKYDAEEIAKEAKSLGMIARKYAENEYMIESREETIITPEEQEPENVGLATLLAAFGITLE